MKVIKKAGIIIAGIMAASTFAACGNSNPTAISTSTSTGENTSVGINTGIGYSESENVSISIPGTYKGVECGFVGDKGNWTNDEEFSLVLNENGTGINKRDGQEFDLEWKMDGSTFLMTDKYLGITIDYTGSFDGNKLTIFNGDPESDLTYEYVYEKE